MNIGHRILVADDNLDFCSNLIDILELQGYEAESVSDGFKAVDAVKENGFDLVLMDIKMPGIDGVEAFKRLKKISPGIRVIMMTAYAVEDLVREALRDGAFGAFYKPLDMERLFSSIEKALPDGALIMVVDDDRDLLASLAEALSGKGYRVGIARDGRTAVQMATENRFDVLLLEMRSPIVDGPATYRAILDIRPGVVTIIMTDRPVEMQDQARDAMQEDVYAYFEKPLDMERLTECIQEAMEIKCTKRR